MKASATHRHNGYLCVPVEGTRRKLAGRTVVDVRYLGDDRPSFAPYAAVDVDALVALPRRMPPGWQVECHQRYLHGLDLEVRLHPNGSWHGSLHCRWHLRTGAVYAPDEYGEELQEAITTNSTGFASAYGPYDAMSSAPEAAQALDLVADQLKHWRAVLAFVRAAPALLRVVRSSGGAR